LFPDFGGTNAFATPPALELPLVLQHTLKGFQLGVIVESDEAAARERLGFNFGALLAHSNALLTRPERRVVLVEAKTKEEIALLARSFAAHETALKQELACFVVMKKISLNNFTPSAERLPSWRQESWPCESESLSWKSLLRHPNPRWRGLKKGPSIKKRSWVEWRPNSFNKLRGSKKPSLS